MSSRGYLREQRFRAIAKKERLIKLNRNKFCENDCSGKLAKAGPKKVKNSYRSSGSRGNLLRMAVQSELADL